MGLIRGSLEDGAHTGRTRQDLMDIERISVESKAEWLALRAKDITSTEIAALFGDENSPYLTRFDLWHRKRGQKVVEIDTSERMAWGLRLEDAIARGVAEDHGLSIRRINQYMRIPSLRLGASFDFGVDATGDLGPGLLEIKNVDAWAAKERWIIDGDHVEAPVHIELQLQHQLLVSGRKRGYIAALVGGNRVLLLSREASKSVHDEILSRSDAFWKSVDAGAEPPPVYPRDASTVIDLHRICAPCTVAQPTQELATLSAEYAAASAMVKAAEQDRSVAKARIMCLIGDAERVTGDGWTISAGTVASRHVEAYDTEPYRNFRVTFKKGK